MINTSSVAVSSIPSTTSANKSSSSTSSSNSSSSSSSTGTGSSTSTSSIGLDQETFLKLLTTQLQYQDPLSPEDPKDFVAQLAQFSTVEQLINLNSKYDTTSTDFQNLQTTMGMGQAVSMLGKTVKAEGNNLSVTSGNAGDMDLILGGSASKVTISIYNSANQLVRTIDAGSMSSGENQVTWDGKDSSGKQVADGTYTYSVSAVDSKGSKVTSATLVSGTVSEVLQNQNTVYLKVNGKLITLDNVVSVEPS